MPPAPSPQTALVANVAEVALLLAGLVLLWLLVLSPGARARARTTPPALEPWAPPASDVLLYLLVMAGAILLGSAVVGGIASRFVISTDARLILGTAGLQVGLMVAALLLPLRAQPDPFTLTALRRGAATFLVALPLVEGATFGWVQLLHAGGFSTDQQDVVRLFFDVKSPVLLSLLVILPVAIAPFGEELLFRATIFRYLRSTKLPRWVVLALPAVIFASFHFSLVALVPLVVLALVFSLAYERTGHIGTTIVAHALFNLHTVVLLLAGVNS